MHGGLWEYWRGLRSRGGERQQAGSSNMRGFMGGVSPEGCVDTHRDVSGPIEAGLGGPIWRK